MRRTKIIATLGPASQEPESIAALIESGGTVTYGELRSQVAATRSGLVAAGVGPGDRVGLISGNDVAFVVCYFAALGVPEVWCWDGIAVRIHVLNEQGEYGLAERSPTFPWMPPGELARFLRMEDDMLTIVRAFREWARECLAEQPSSD